MINRISWAAALMAAAGLACSDAPKNTRPVTNTRPAPVAKKIGTYTMTITPMATAGGRQARVEVVPDLQDGNPNTNPAGSVQVAGRFAAVIDTGATNGCGVRSLNLPLTITNFAADPLANVQVQITEMSRTGFEVCAPATGNAALLPTPADATPGATFGLVNYGTMAGSPVNDGTAPGTPQTVQWWFKYPSNTAVSFTFVVWADPRQPEQVSVPDLLTGSPLTWTSTGSASGQLELCTTDPFLSNGACPAGNLTVTAATGVANGAGGWDFAAIPATVDGTTYWWRARNTFAGVAGNFASGWDTFVATVPFNPPSPTITAPAPVAVPPATLAQFPADIIVPATLAPLDVAWTSAPTVEFTHILICDTIDCLPSFPGVGVLDESWEAGAPNGTPPNLAFYDYLFDASLSIPTDPLTGDTLLATGVYYVNVYNWDDLAGADVGAPAVSAFEIVAPGAPAVPPPNIVGPAGPELDPLFGREEFPANSPAIPAEILLMWTTDPSILDSQYELCDTPDCLPAAGFVGSLTGGPVPVVGFVPAVGAQTEFSVDAVPDLPLDPASGGIWLLPGIYWFQVTNLDAFGAPVGATVVSSFLVVSSMPALPGAQAPATGTAFSQQAYVFPTARQVAPVVLSWSSPAEVVETELEIAYTPDFATPMTVRVPSTGTAGALNTYALDLTDPLSIILFDDVGLLPLGSGGTYLQPGLVYWRVYNVDAASGNFLSPPSAASNIDLTPFSPGFAVTIPAAAPFTVTITGATTLANAYVQLCDTVDCLPLGLNVGLLGAEGTATATATPGTFTFSLEAFAQQVGLAPGSTVYFRVVDDEVALQTFTDPPAANWFYPTGAANYPVTLP